MKSVLTMLNFLITLLIAVMLYNMLNDSMLLVMDMFKQTTVNLTPTSTGGF